MNKAYELLGLDAGAFENFALRSREIEKNVGIDRILRNATRRLESIADSVADDGGRPMVSQSSVDDVIHKVKLCSANGGGEWTAKELRIVSYYLSQLINSKSFDYAVRLLDTRWKDMYIGGLVFFLMNSWFACRENQLIAVSKLLTGRLKLYNGTIKRYRTLKQHVDFFDTAGPKRLSALMLARNMALEDAPTLLGYRTSALTLPYFSDVIINYFKSREDIDYGEMEDILEQNPHDRTRKLTYAFLVEKAENSGDTNFQDSVVRSARRILGDINMPTTWAPFKGAKADEIEQLDKARDLIIAWGVRKTVDAFFDICVQDPRRRNFWLQYVGSITDYRIVGSTAVKTKLKANAEVAPLLNSCFIDTNSTISTTAALVLFIKNKVLIEFSDIGALYVYNSSNPNIKDIKRKRSISSTAALKETSMPMVIEDYSSWNPAQAYCREEGRLPHLPNWEDRLKYWLSKMLGVYPQKVQRRPKPKQLSLQQSQSIEKKNKSSEKTELPMQTIEKRECSNDGHKVENQNCEQGKTLPGANTYQPALLITNKVYGIQSKWIFDETCRVLVDLDGIYICIRNKNCLYYVAPSRIPNLYKRSIWLVPDPSSNDKFEVKIAMHKGSHSTPDVIWIGSIERLDSHIIYNTLSGGKMLIDI